MNGLRGPSSCVSAVSYPAAVKAVVFKTPATGDKIGESDSHTLADDCLHDRQVLQMMMVSGFMFRGGDTFGYIRHRPGIAGSVAKLLVGDMYHVRGFNVRRGILP